MILLQNGSYNGLLGELQQEKSDIGWANLFYNYDR